MSKRGSYHRTTEVTRNERHKRLHDSLRITAQQKEIAKACNAFDLKRGITTSDTPKERFNKGVAASMRTRKPVEVESLFESKKWKRKPQQVETMSLAMLLIKEVAMAGRRDGMIKEQIPDDHHELTMIKIKRENSAVPALPLPILPKSHQKRPQATHKDRQCGNGTTSPNNHETLTTAILDGNQSYASRRQQKRNLFPAVQT